MGAQKGCILIKQNPRAQVLLQPHGGGDSEMRKKQEQGLGRVDGEELQCLKMQLVCVVQ